MRVKETSSHAAALDQINRVQATVSKQFPGADLQAIMVPLDEQITGRSKAGLQLLLGAVGVVLLIGCVNITNLLLARSTQRRREIAVRSAIGASSDAIAATGAGRKHDARGAGPVVGLVLAHVVLQTVLVYAPIDLPRMDEVRLDARVFAFTAVITALTSLVCGLLPAWHFAKADPHDAMKSISRSATSGRAAGRLRSALVASEVALSAICLVAAGLLLHSFVRLMNVDPGFRSERVMTVDLSLPGVRYPNPPKRVEFYRLLLSEVTALPGVVSAGITNGLPVTADGGRSAIVVEGVTLPLIERPIADIRNVNPDFFRTMGIGLRAGVYLSESDREGRTAVISDRWPSAHGRTSRRLESDSRWAGRNRRCMRSSAWSVTFVARAWPEISSSRPCTSRTGAARSAT